MPTPIKGIGRQVQIGIAKEITRGTSPVSPAYYLAWEDGLPEEKFENVDRVESFGVLEDSDDSARVKNWMESSLKIPVTDTSFGLFLLSLLGTDTPVAEGSPNGSVYDHAFTNLQNVQKPSLSLYLHDPLAGQDYAHANCVVTKLEIDVSLKKFISATVGIKGLKGAQISSLTPAQTVENRFVPQYATFKTAANYSGLATGTAVGIKNLKLTIEQNVDDDDVVGNIAPRDYLAKELKIEGTLEAIFNGEADFKTTALANTYKAIRIAIVNSDVTIGSSAHPQIILDLAKCYFKEYSMPRKLKDLVYQTLKFKAYYSVSDALMAKFTMSNLLASY